MTDDSKLLEHFIDSELSEFEKIEFKKRYEESEEFKQSIIEASVLMASLESINSPIEKPNRKQLPHLSRYISGIAVAAAILCGIFLMPQKENFDTLYLDVEKLPSIERAIESNPKITNATLLYYKASNLKDKEEQINAFNKAGQAFKNASITPHSESNYKANYAAGLAYFASTDYKNAESCFLCALDGVDDTRGGNYIKTMSIFKLFLTNKKKMKKEQTDRYKSYLIRNYDEISLWLSDDQLDILNQVLNR